MNNQALIQSTSRFDLRALSVIALCFSMAACEAPPPRRVVVQDQPVEQRLIVYPAKGQSADQTDRDRYECHVWAVQQSNFDPSRPGLPPGERVIVQPANPPGSGTAVGAIAGAILGAAIGGPRNAGAGLVVGGITGAAIGASSDNNAQAQASIEQAQYNRSYAQNVSAAGNYRRAVSACLDARGYTIG